MRTASASDEALTEGAIVTPTFHWCTGTWDPDLHPVCYYTATSKSGYAGVGPFSIRAVRYVDNVEVEVFRFECPAGERCVSDPLRRPIPSFTYVTVRVGETGAVEAGTWQGLDR